MQPTLIVTHLPDRAVGIVRACLRDGGSEVITCNPRDRAPLPRIDEISGIVSLGGRQSATRVERDPFLAAEVRLLAAALRRSVPVLGMCLGAQLLAVAAGGRVTAMGRMQAGWPELAMAPAAADDPLFGGFPTTLPVLAWHEDMIQAPAHAVALGTTGGPGAALFRIGRSAWGSQAHLELTAHMLLTEWLTDPVDVAEVEAAGNEIDRFRADSRAHLARQIAAARPMFRAFGALASGRAASQAA